MSTTVPQPHPVIFYPDLQMVENDLHAKGLLEAGKHTILIDW